MEEGAEVGLALRRLTRIEHGLDTLPASAPESDFRSLLDEYMEAQRIAGVDESAESTADADAKMRARVRKMPLEERVRWIVAWAGRESKRAEWIRLRARCQELAESHAMAAVALRDLRRQRKGKRGTRQRRLTPALIRDLLELSRTARGLRSENRAQIRAAVLGGATADREKWSARDHARALAAIRVQIEAALLDLRATARALWPELGLGTSRPADIVDLRVRRRLTLRWGFTDRDLAAARVASTAVADLIRDRRGSAARHARRRSIRARPKSATT